MHPTPDFSDTAFDLRARAELAWAYEPQDAPAHLYRHTPWTKRLAVQRTVAVLLLAAGGTGAVLAMRPPALVRGAMEHEVHERTLRGQFMDSAPLLQHLGLAGAKSLPGFPQLARPCDIEGHLTYHLTTFFEKGGLVTVFAFDQPVTLAQDHGWWGDTYWRVIRSRTGQPLVLVSQRKQAIVAAERALLQAPPT